jgi:hypothetical protein
MKGLLTWIGSTAITGIVILFISLLAMCGDAMGVWG